MRKLGLSILIMVSALVLSHGRTEGACAPPPCAVTPPLMTHVHLNPGVIHLTRPAGWLIAYIEPVGFSPSDIDISSLRLAGSVSPDPRLTKVVDHDFNGLPELMVRFSSAAIDPLLTLGANHLEVTASLVTGEHCSGSDTVRVVDSQPSPRPASVAPNPLNPAGSLSFYVGTAGHVSVRVFDRGGGLVRTMLDVPSMAVGSQHVSIDGRSDRGAQMASGIYFYRINTPDGTVTGRFTILK
jgi:hypothetical protein